MTRHRRSQEDKPQIDKMINAMKKSIIRKIVVGALLMAAVPSSAQTLSTIVGTYKGMCLDMRQAVNNADGRGARECRDHFAEFGKRYKIADLQLRPASDTEELSTEGHVILDPVYLDSLIRYDMDFAMVNYDEHAARRGYGGSGERVFVSHKVVAAGSSATYKYKGVGDMELAVVAERETNMSLIVESNGHSQTVSCTDDSGVVEHSWQLPNNYEGNIVITIANPTDSDLAVTVISN